ncbi:unnamed protein product [Adineta steineri]|uniref:Uncharacterized protein n=1 Tax=Adineta steineri TaxID=433720 RepID=A0A814LYA4_9BILA|nr:unnamed protein product [Adineta steineri]CAF1071858.1 unnamed protein product [Adineta steineri]
MAKSGFMPAWMKISNSDKTNPNQKYTNEQSQHSYGKDIDINSQRRLHLLPTNLDKRSRFLNSKTILLLLSVPETTEEKELLIRMGWNNDMTYEITDTDKEEYEKQIKYFPKLNLNNRSSVLMSALNRRALPYINIQDIFQHEMIDSQSDDDD